MATIKYLKDVNNTRVYPVTHERAVRDSDGTTLESKLQNLESKTYIVAWDGTGAPTTSNIPSGVTVTYNDTTYTGSKAASASTVGKIYLVSDGNGQFNRYITSQSGSTYSWTSLGSAAMTLEIVNNLYDGGATKALSAEQGVAIADELLHKTGGVTVYNIERANTLSTYKDGYQLRANPSLCVGANIGDVGTTAGAGYKNYRIPVSGAYSVTYFSYASSSGYGSLFIDDEGTVISSKARTSDEDNPYTILVPEHATTFIWSTSSTARSQDNCTCIVNYNNPITTGAEAKTAVEELDRTLNGGIITYRMRDIIGSTYGSFYSRYKQYSISGVIGQTLASQEGIDANNYCAFLIDIPTGATAVGLTLGTSSSNGALIVNSEGIIVQTIGRPTGTDTNVKTALVTGATKILWALNCNPGYWSDPRCEFYFDHITFSEDYITEGQLQTNVLYLEGDNDNLVYSRRYYGLINGKTYTINVKNPNISRTGVTVSGSAYIALKVNLVNDTTGVETQIHNTSVEDNLPSTITFAVPDDENQYYCYAVHRATYGEKQYLVINEATTSASGVDLTDEVASLKHTVDGVTEYSGLLTISNLFPLLEGHPHAQIGTAQASIDSDLTFSGENLTYSNYVIPIEGYKYIEWLQYRSDANRGSVFIDENGKFIDGVTLPTSSENNVATRWVPSKSKYFVFSVPESYSETAYIKLYKEADWVKDQKDAEENTIKTITGGSITYSVANMEDKMRLNKYSMGQLKVNGASGSIDSVVKNKVLSYTNYLVPVAGWDRVSFDQYGTTAGYGSAFLDSELNIVQAVTTSSAAVLTRTVPVNAAYLMWSVVTNTAAITLYADDSMASSIELLGSQITELSVGGGTDSVSTGLAPILYKGIIASNGATTESDNYLTTETIFGPFQIELADDYRVYSASLFDRKGNIVSYEYVHPDIFHAGRNRSSWSNGIFFSTAKCVPDYGYRLVICKSNQGTIPDGAKVIKKFVSLKDAGLHRWVPDDLPNYDIALDRIDMSQRIVWTPLAKVPAWNSAGTTNVYFHLANQLQIGVPYSDVAQTRKYVPNNVSVRTFLTAVKNKRSLLYTEDLVNNTSHYGMTYTGGNRRSYYGEVCSGFTAWVMGLNTLYLSTAYNGLSIPGLSAVSNPDASNVRPLDLIWNEGHISIISDIYKDDFGKVKYIVWAEMSTPYTYRSLYTPEQFEARLAAISGKVRRWSGWANLTAPADFTQFVPYGFGTTLQDYDYCPDIMTFAGDYAAFAAGDKIVLNCKRNNSYTAVVLYKDNAETPLNTIDISTLTADTLYPDDNEDWVALDLTSQNLSAGKYKACMTDGTDTSGYTYFEVIEASLSATISGSDLVIAFSATGGTPVSIEQTQTSGFAYQYHPVTAAEVTAGTITVDWSYNATYPKLYLLVNGDYGTVCKVIDIPQS